MRRATTTTAGRIVWGRSIGSVRPEFRRSFASQRLDAKRAPSFQQGGYLLGAGMAALVGGAGVALAAESGNKPKGGGWFSSFFGGKKQLPAIVVCGPSGVGKGTIIGEAMKARPDQFGFSVSHTTRKPREGEKDGVHYNFTTVPEIEAAIKRGEFIEYANVHGNYYGTSKASVAKVATQGKICILDIDVQGATSCKAAELNAKYVFILPPSMAELERRLRGRGTEKEEAIQKRLGNAQGEIDKTNDTGFFDLVFKNETVEESTKKFLAFVDNQVAN